MSTGPEIAQKAKEQLAQLTGLEPVTVSSLKKDEDGWHVTVDMLEMKYVPDTGDLLATYETLLDDKGKLISYQRTRRYRRDQVMEEE
ncbi:MAG: gas vesicle protein [Chloroflexi bacterium]|nr:gas vesicle protein [Chloroflexota bacterium]MBU1661041.1 gas vesicle protein [Chloroflexota bacterium]